MKSILQLRSGWCAALLVVAAMGLPAAVAAPAAAQPNIVIIYSDDVGFGDLGCYGGTPLTPNIDRLAAGGLRFTDAHATASTCTPSRYSLLTGRYAFREKRAKILAGDAPLLIEPGSPTLPQVLRDRGYRTAVIGKWHLGLGTGDVDWNKDVAPGPLEVGFDESFIIPATPDRVPCVYVDGHRVHALDTGDPLRISYTHRIGDEPTGAEHPELLRYPASRQHQGTIVDHISRIGYMAGGHAAWWRDEDMATELTARAVTFVEQHATRPFFLYFAINDVHVPRAPADRFVRASQHGLRGAALAEMDWSVGEMLAALDRLHLRENTLIIFSSDNGPIVEDGYADGSRAQLGDSRPAGPYRGGKYQIFEGGTRLPFIVAWPGHVPVGESAALLSHVDLLASLATLAGADAPAAYAVDSRNVLPALLGQTRPARTELVEAGMQTLALRSGAWKYVPPGKRGRIENGIGDPTDGPTVSTGALLYDLSTDPGERHNVAAAHADIVQQLAARLQTITGG